MNIIFSKIADKIAHMYYAYMVYEIIMRVFTVEHKMYAIDENQEEDISKITMEQKSINEYIDKKQNNIRYRVYKKMILSIFLTVLPFLIKYIYFKKNGQEINTVYLAIFSFTIHVIMNRLVDMEFTLEELDFIDN